MRTATSWPTPRCRGGHQPAASIAGDSAIATRGGAGQLLFSRWRHRRGESAQDAVRRELWEELGVRVRPRRALWHNVTSWRVALDWWWTDLDEAAVLHPNPDEVEAVHWMTPDQMLALPELLESNRQFLHAWQGGQFQLWDPC